LVDNLAVSRSRGGKIARTLSRAELEDWVVRTSQRRPDGWLLLLRGRALEVCRELDVPADLPALSDDHATTLPFFEAYFSNFIEGTEFSIEEAEAIVKTGDVPKNRPEDAHDVLGTFEAVADPERALRTDGATSSPGHGRTPGQEARPAQGEAEPVRILRLRGAGPRGRNPHRRVPAAGRSAARVGAGRLRAVPHL
jgi:hypothetical protein